jgi:hypothetical protein
VARVSDLVDRATFRRPFESFEHTAWRPATRRGYASDREDPDFQAFQAGGSSPCQSDEPWFVTIRAQADAEPFLAFSSPRRWPCLVAA